MNWIPICKVNILLRRRFSRLRSLYNGRWGAVGDGTKKFDWNVFESYKLNSSMHGSLKAFHFILLVCKMLLS